ncbi:hypothetical protein GCM10023208_06870 [Erythrobacter westpacificensis]|uniref:Transposase n=1 Tax=Erythrobacter westpacificensis TaxID=1055231 RepID=A0ABP9K402_9SPHN
MHLDLHQNSLQCGIVRQPGKGRIEYVASKGVSEATIYNWKSKYGGLEVSDARRLKALESESARLKRLLADAMLDKAALTRRAA